MRWWRNDALIAVLAILSVAVVYWYDITEPTGMLRTVILVADAILIVWFVADWGLDVKEARRPKAHFIRTWWHLLGMVPLVFASLGFLRLIRLVRVFTALDQLPAVRRRVDRLTSNFKGSDLKPLVFASAIITFGGAVLVWLAERGENPRFEEFNEAIWWAVVTVTTVGYGDITPITRIGRSIAVVLMVTGIGTIGVLASQVSAAIIRGEDEEEAHRATGPNGAPPTLASQLATLSDLHRDGQITDDEYHDAKSQTLANGNSSSTK